MCLIVTVIVCRVCFKKTQALEERIENIAQGREANYGGEYNFGMTPRSSHSASRDFGRGKVNLDDKESQSSNESSRDMFTFPAPTGNGYFPPLGDQKIMGYVPQRTRVRKPSLNSTEESRSDRQGRKKKLTRHDMDYFDSPENMPRSDSYDEEQLKKMLHRQSSQEVPQLSRSSVSSTSNRGGGLYVKRSNTSDRTQRQQSLDRISDEQQDGVIVRDEGYGSRDIDDAEDFLRPYWAVVNNSEAPPAEVRPKKQNKITLLFPIVQ